MARRKQAAAEAVSSNSTELTSTDNAQAPANSDATELAPRRWTGPSPRKTVNLDGLKVTLQESRPEGQPWQMQIKFGDDSLEQKPSDAVLEFIKSHRKHVTTRDGEEKDVRLFQWNNDEKAWAIRLRRSRHVAAAGGEAVRRGRETHPQGARSESRPLTLRRIA